MFEIRSIDLHPSRSKWHPAFSKFDFDARQNAEDASREGEELREKLRGRRILEATK